LRQRGALGDTSRCAIVLVMPHYQWQSEPVVHRFLKNRVAWRRESSDLERAYGYPADGRIAIPFPISRATAVRAEVKADTISRISFPLVYFTRAFETDPFFQVRRAEVECCACPALTCLTVAQINAFWVTRRDNAKRPAVTLPISFHESVPHATQHDFLRRLGQPEHMSAADKHTRRRLTR
jgi:hypothetical protein